MKLKVRWDSFLFGAFLGLLFLFFQTQPASAVFFIKHPKLPSLPKLPKLPKLPTVPTLPFSNKPTPTVTLTPSPTITPTSTEPEKPAICGAHCTVQMNITCECKERCFMDENDQPACAYSSECDGPDCRPEPTKEKEMTVIPNSANPKYSRS